MRPTRKTRRLPGRPCRRPTWDGANKAIVRQVQLTQRGVANPRGQGATEVVAGQVECRQRQQEVEQGFRQRTAEVVVGQRERVEDGHLAEERREGAAEAALARAALRRGEGRWGG
eukprot:360879-Chlamydomonas_euryale.AAC.4